MQCPWLPAPKKYPHDNPDVLEHKVGRHTGQEVWQLHDVAKDKAILHQKAQEQIDLGRDVDDCSLMCK